MSSSGRRQKKPVKKECKNRVAADPLHDDDDDEPDPDVEELKSTEICADNHTTCVNDNIDAVREVFDEETCLGMLISYYKIYKEVNLSEETTQCQLSGCEFDYSSNTYRLCVELSSGSVTIGEHFIVVKIDSCSGFPKVLSVR